MCVALLYRPLKAKKNGGSHEKRQKNNTFEDLKGVHRRKSFVRTGKKNAVGRENVDAVQVPMILATASVAVTTNAKGGTGTRRESAEDQGIALGEIALIGNPVGEETQGGTVMNGI